MVFRSRERIRLHRRLVELAVLVPVPRKNLIRFHGVLAPAAKWRPRIVPLPAVEAESSCSHSRQEPSESKRQRNYEWSYLMKRVFELDVLQCPNCHNRLKHRGAHLTQKYRNPKRLQTSIPGFRSQSGGYVGTLHFSNQTTT